MAPRKQSKHSKAQDRQFWSWTRLRWSREKKDELLKSLLGELYESGLLGTDLRRTETRKRLNDFLDYRLPYETGLSNLYCIKGEGLKKRLMRLIAARKRGFIKEEEKSGNTRDPESETDVLERFDNDYFLSYDTLSEGDGNSSLEELGLQLTFPRGHDDVLHGWNDESERLLQELRALEPGNAPVEGSQRQSPRLPLFQTRESFNPQRLSSSVRSLEDYSRLERLPNELIEMIGRYLGFGDLQILSRLCKITHEALKPERIRRLGRNPLASLEDYQRYLHVSWDDNNRIRVVYDTTAPYIEQPMLWAVENGFWNIVEAFLSRRTHPDSCSLSGNTMLHVAITRNQTSCVKLLLKWRASVDRLDPAARMSPLLAALLARSDATHELLAHHTTRRTEMSHGEFAILQRHVRSDPMLHRWLFVNGFSMRDLRYYESSKQFLDMVPIYIMPDNRRPSAPGDTPDNAIEVESDDE